MEDGEETPLGSGGGARDLDGAFAVTQSLSLAGGRGLLELCSQSVLLARTTFLDGPLFVGPPAGRWGTIGPLDHERNSRFPLLLPAIPPVSLEAWAVWARVVAQLLPSLS